LKLFSLKTAAPSISPVITLSFAKRVSPVHNFAARHVHHKPTCCSLFKATLSKFHSRPTVLPWNFVLTNNIFIKTIIFCYITVNINSCIWLTKIVIK